MSYVCVNHLEIQKSFIYCCCCQYHASYTFPSIDIMSKAIQDLLALVKLLREEVAHQTSEINHLRRLIENCAGCRESEPQITIKENCDNSNPCFEGVQCYDSSTGVRCGRCPSGRRQLYYRRISQINRFKS